METELNEFAVADYEKLPLGVTYLELPQALEHKLVGLASLNYPDDTYAIEFQTHHNPRAGGSQGIIYTSAAWDEMNPYLEVRRPHSSLIIELNHRLCR